VIAGRYKIETRLGQGGMGTVWRAQHLALRSPVAVKLIDPARASSEEAVARFLREAQSAAALRSPHVVQILDHGVDAGVPYIAMELLEGESLADRLDRVGRLNPADTLRIMTHVGRAMSRAHEAGIVHRDLKPDNVFLVRNDDEEIAKVLDFGIAKTTLSNAFDVTTGTRTGELLGTPYYMSPEQVEGQRDLDHRTDLWAMAVITFECLVGSRPFESETLGSLLLQICTKPIVVPSQVADVPPGFDTWFARGTRRTPEERYRSARELIDALQAVLTQDKSRLAALVTPMPSESGKSAPVDVAHDDTLLPNAPATPLASLAESVVRPMSVPGMRRRTSPLVLGAALACGVAAAVAAWLLTRPEPTLPVSARLSEARSAQEVVKPVPEPAAAAAAPIAPAAPAPLTLTPAPPLAPTASPAPASPRDMRAEAAKPTPRAKRNTKPTERAPSSAPAQEPPPADLGF
jgi:serine/threonine protein kinase